MEYNEIKETIEAALTEAARLSVYRSHSHDRC